MFAKTNYHISVTEVHVDMPDHSEDHETGLTRVKSTAVLNENIHLPNRTYTSVVPTCTSVELEGFVSHMCAAKEALYLEEKVWPTLHVGLEKLLKVIKHHVPTV